MINLKERVKLVEVDVDAIIILRWEPKDVDWIHVI